jgi:hypothetical protein
VIAMTPGAKVNLFAAIVLLTVGFCFYALPYLYAVNIPNADDFDMLLGAVLDLEQAGSWREGLAVILRPHGEHYVVFARLCAWLCYALSGQLNFRILILFGDLSVFLILYLLFISFKADFKAKAALFLPAALLLLQPAYVESLMWASGALQNLWSWVFCLGALLLGFKPGVKAWLFSFALAVLAALSQANGILVLLVISLVHALNCKWRWACLFLATGVGVVFLYWYAHGATLMAAGSAPNLTGVAEYALCFLGSAFGFGSYWISLIAGLVLVAGLLYCGRKGCAQNPVFYGLLIFIAGTAALNAGARAQFGLDFAFSQSRYKFPAVLYMAAVYLLVVEMLVSGVFKDPSRLSVSGGNARWIAVPRVLSGLLESCFAGQHAGRVLVKLWFCAGMVLFAGFSLCSYLANYPEFVLRYELLNDSTLRWAIARLGLEYPDQSRAAWLVQGAAQRQIYALPEIDPGRYTLVSETNMPKLIPGKFVSAVEYVLQNERYALISGYVLTPGAMAAGGRISVLLQGRKSSLTFPVHARQRPDAARHHSQKYRADTGFLMVVDLQTLLPDHYAIGLINQRDQIGLLVISGKYLSLGAGTTQ